jgi:hypothetical protein
LDGPKCGNGALEAELHVAYGGGLCGRKVRTARGFTDRQIDVVLRHRPAVLR